MRIEITLFDKINKDATSAINLNIEGECNTLMRLLGVLNDAYGAENIR